MGQKRKSKAKKKQQQNTPKADKSTCNLPQSKTATTMENTELRRSTRQRTQTTKGMYYANTLLENNDLADGEHQQHVILDESPCKILLEKEKSLIHTPQAILTATPRRKSTGCIKEATNERTLSFLNKLPENITPAVRTEESESPGTIPAENELRGSSKDLEITQVIPGSEVCDDQREEDDWHHADENDVVSNKSCEAEAQTISTSNNNPVEVEEQVIIPTVLKETVCVFNFAEKAEETDTDDYAFDDKERATKDALIKNLKEELDQVNTKFNLLNRNFMKTLEEKKILDDRVRLLENNSYRERVLELERIMGENETCIRELEIVAAKSEKQKKEKDDVISKLKEKVDSLDKTERHVQELKAEAKDKDEAVNKLKEEVKEIEKERTENNSSWAETFESQKREIGELITKCDDQKHTINDTKANIKALTDENARLRSESTKLKNKLKVERTIDDTVGNNKDVLQENELFSELTVTINALTDAFAVVNKRLDYHDAVLQQKGSLQQLTHQHQQSQKPAHLQHQQSPQDSQLEHQQRPTQPRNRQQRQQPPPHDGQQQQQQHLQQQQQTQLSSANRFSALAFSSNNPQLTQSPIEEDVDENGVRQRVVPGPRTYSEVTERGEETIIFSNSITKGINRREFNDWYDGEGTLSFRRFHGGKARHITHYLKPHLEEVAPKTVIIQSGGNDLPITRDNPPTPVAEIAAEVMKSGDICKHYGVENVIISGVPIRSKSYIQRRCSELNTMLQDACAQKGFLFIDNTNIDTTHLLDDGTHLKYDGTCILANNYLNCLNSLHWERVRRDLPED